MGGDKMGFIEFLASTWWVWLVLAIVCYGYVIGMFIRKLKEKEEELDFNESFDNFFEGFLGMIFAAGAGTIFLILFILGLIPAYAQALIRMIF
ncbi:hypothetical protein KAW43_02020 [Candidatus Parcubacteria bacterium]|nr:hypothetical protein [Candidatus Parcubacteria bacterium]